MSERTFDEVTQDQEVLDKARSEFRKLTILMELVENDLEPEEIKNLNKEDMDFENLKQVIYEKISDRIIEGKPPRIPIEEYNKVIVLEKPIKPLYNPFIFTSNPIDAWCTYYINPIITKN